MRDMISPLASITTSLTPERLGKSSTFRHRWASHGVMQIKGMLHKRRTNNLSVAFDFMVKQGWLGKQNRFHPLNYKCLFTLLAAWLFLEAIVAEYTRINGYDRDHQEVKKNS